jgi:nitrate reductase cytochrome c-type subunit
MMKTLSLMVFAVFMLMLAVAGSNDLRADELKTLRYGEPIDQEATPVPIPKVINEDVRSKRNYPMQPPLIPHHIRGYQVNLQVNKCMSCHARKRVEESLAPMISVTHYMDREGNFLAEISPRRYFCNQCHVTQTDSRLTVENEFKDMDDLLNERAGNDSSNQE